LINLRLVLDLALDRTTQANRLRTNPQASPGA
jgi:hypothetical protein